MNKIFAKFMALAVSAAMIIPSVAIANEEVITDEIEVAAVEETVDAELLADLKPAEYAELIVGPEKGTDIYYNNMDKPDMRFSGDNNFELKDCDGTCNSKNSLFDKNAKYDVDCATDLVVIRKNVDGEDAAYTTYFHATQASGTAGWRYNRNGVISVFTAKTFDDSSNTNYVIEWDYYADKANRIQLIYAADGANKDLFFDKAYDEAEGPAWKTMNVELDDFYAHRVDTGLGQNENVGGSASDGGFRFQSAGGSDVIIKAIRVYTPGYTTMTAALENCEIENAEEIRENFVVPTYYDDVQIEWKSSNSAISIDADGKATVTRSPYSNVDVTLTATATYNGFYLEKEIPVTVFTSNEAQAALDSHMANVELDVSDPENVTEDFVLPVAPDGFEYEWASTNKDYVDVSDGINAVVNASKFEQSSAVILLTVYYEDKFAEKEFDLSSPALYKEVKGSKVVANAQSGNQVVGDMVFDGNFQNYTVYDEPTIPEGINTTKKVYYLTDVSSDFGNARATVGDKDYVVTGYCYSTTRSGGGDFSYNMPVNAGKGFTAEDKKLTIEIQYLDKAKGNLVVKYVNGAYGTGSAAGKTWSPTKVGATIEMKGDGQFKTYTFETDEAYFVEDNKTGMGATNKADIRIEASGSVAYVHSVSIYTGKAFEDIAKAKDAVVIENVDLENVSENFELPTSLEGGVEVEWSSKDKEIISIEDGVACIYPSTDEKLTTTLVAAILKDGGYATKEFEVTLAKLPKSTPVVAEPTVTQGQTTTNIAFTIENTSNIRGEELTAMAIITDDNGKVIAKETSSVVVTSGITEVDVDIQNAAAGQKLNFYVVNEIGAVVANRAPGAPVNFTAKSGKNGGRVFWEEAGDDYRHVVYDIYKNGELWIKGTEELSAEADSDEMSEFYVIARDHEGLVSAATEKLKAGKYDYLFACFDDYNEATSPVTVMDGPATLDKGTVKETRTGADTVDGDGVTPVTLNVYRTFSGAERLAAGAAQNKGYPTRMQYQAKGVIAEGTPGPHHVMIIVKYFDEGTGAVTVTYSQDNSLKDLANSPFVLTNTKTWKEVVIEIPDANFTRGGNGVEGADFFFKTNANNGILAINKVTVVPYEYY